VLCSDTGFSEARNPIQLVSAPPSAGNVIKTHFLDNRNFFKADSMWHRRNHHGKRAIMHILR
jgi:hypothetical protein